MNRYKYILGSSCCNGEKVSIYELIDGKYRCIETYGEFETRQDAKTFAIKRIQELEDKREVDEVIGKYSGRGYLHK